MNVLLDIRTEIELIRKHEQNGLTVIKGSEKLSMNNYHKGLYLDLTTFATTLGTTVNQLLEVIGYSPTQRGYLAFFREGYEAIRVIDISGLNELTRNLAGSGMDIEMLKMVREQVYKAVEALEKEVYKNGTN